MAESISITQEQFEEMLAKAGAKEKTSKKKTKKKADVVMREPLAKEEDSAVYQAIHFYARDSWQKALRHAQDEREDRSGTTIRVFAHNHIFGAACVKGCREVVSDDGRDEVEA